MRNEGAKRTGSFLLWTVMAILLARGVWAQEGTQTPKAEIDLTIWELGKVQPDRTYIQTFRLTNVGQGKLAVSELRVSSENMSARAIPVGTEEGKLYQIEIQMHTPKVSGPFEGFVFLLTNDPENEAIKILVRAEVGEGTESAAAPSTPAGLPIARVFYSVSDEVLETLRTLAKDCAGKMEVLFLNVGETQNFLDLSKLERELEVKDRASVELFIGRAYLPGAQAAAAFLRGVGQGMTPAEAMDAVVRGAPAHVHEAAAGTPEAKTGIVPPPPLAVEIFFDPRCEHCRQAVEKFANEAGDKYADRYAMRALDTAKPEIAQILGRILGATYDPKTNPMVAVVGGQKYFAGHENVLAALAAHLDRAPTEGGNAQRAESTNYAIEFGASGNTKKPQRKPVAAPLAPTKTQTLRDLPSPEEILRKWPGAALVVAVGFAGIILLMAFRMRRQGRIIEDLARQMKSS